MPTVGFLDDLKRQADAAKALQHTDTGALARNAQLADAACRGAATYFGTLAQQLNVLRPRSKGVFRLDKRHAFESLQLGEFRADARRKQLRGADVFDHIALRWKKRIHRLDKIGTTTGAARFENTTFGLIWIGIPSKGMLLDAKLNRGRARGTGGR